MAKEIILAIFALIFGGCLCFWGYRLFLVMLPIWSFFGGCWLGAKGVTILFGEGFLASATGLTTGLILGVILAIFSWQFYDLGVAVLGALLGAWLGSNVMKAIGFASANPLTLMVALGGAIALGILTYVRNWQQFIVMILTGIAGAYAIVAGFLLLNGRVTVDALQNSSNAMRSALGDSAIWLIVGVAIAIVGIVVQFRTYRNFVFEKDEFVRYWS